MRVIDHRKVAKRIKLLGRICAWAWDLPLKRIVINEALDDCFGRCWWQRGDVEIRLTTLGDKPRLIKDWHLRDTLAHELAHLIEHGHTKAHRELRDALKMWLKRNWKREWKEI